MKAGWVFFYQYVVRWLKGGYSWRLPRVFYGQGGVVTMKIRTGIVYNDHIEDMTVRIKNVRTADEVLAFLNEATLACDGKFIANAIAKAGGRCSDVVLDDDMTLFLSRFNFSSDSGAFLYEESTGWRQCGSDEINSAVDALSDKMDLGRIYLDVLFKDVVDVYKHGGNVEDVRTLTLLRRATGIDRVDWETCAYFESRVPHLRDLCYSVKSGRKLSDDSARVWHKLVNDLVQYFCFKAFQEALEYRGIASAKRGSVYNPYKLK